MEPVRVFGAAYSVYVRTVRLALHEKGVVRARAYVGVKGLDSPPSSRDKVVP